MSANVAWNAVFVCGMCCRISFLKHKRLYSWNYWQTILLVQFEGCRFVGKGTVVFQLLFVYKFVVNFDSGFGKTNEWKTENTLYTLKQSFVVLTWSVKSYVSCLEFTECRYFRNDVFQKLLTAYSHTNPVPRSKWPNN